MELDLSDAVATTADPDVLWQRLLDPSAVIGVLGVDARRAVIGVGCAKAKDVQIVDSPDAEPFNGHTFRIRGIGGGLYHAAIDQRAEHSMISYAVWREDSPKSPMLLTYTIETSGPQTMLAGVITMNMPLEELLMSLAPGGLFALPFAGPLVRRYMTKRLREQLIKIAAPPIPAHNRRTLP